MDFSKSARKNATTKATTKGFKTITTQSNERVKVFKQDTKNQSGTAAYDTTNRIKLVTYLKARLEKTFYTGINDQAKKIMDVIDTLVNQGDINFVMKAIAYVRNIDGSGSRDTVALASAYMIKYLAGQEGSKLFYSGFNRKTNKGGVVFRGDDMKRILECYNVLNSKNTKSKIPNAIKDGFRMALESFDTYAIIKYWKDLEAIVKLSHPKSGKKHEIRLTLSEKDKAKVEAGVKAKKVLPLVLEGNTFNGDVFLAKFLNLAVENTTVEAVKSEKLRVIDEKVKSGSITATDATVLKDKAKGEATKQVIANGGATMLSTIQQLRQTLKSDDKGTIKVVCDFLENGEAVLKSRLLPFHFDVATEVIKNKFGSTSNGRLVLISLEKAYNLALPNLALIEDALVVLDVSGSMSTQIYTNGVRCSTSCLDKAVRVAATFMVGANADCIQFASNASYVNFNATSSISDVSRDLSRYGGGSTDFASAFRIMRTGYKTIIVLSDNECNNSGLKTAIESYFKKCDLVPTIHTIDLGLSGTSQFKGDYVKYHAGYSFDLFNDIANNNGFDELIEAIEKYQFA